MEVATKAFDSLASKRGDLLEDTFRSVAGFEGKPMAMARQLLRLAALLHDIGHASFSHAAEKVVNKGIGHEELTKMIVSESSLLGSELDRLFWQGCGRLVSQIVYGGREMPPQLQILHDLISGEMDADRTDYLLRDSHHCGVDYGRFDHRRMIECLQVRQGDMGALEIALHRDGIHTFEALIFARYQMNTQVYFHRLRRIYDRYLVEYHRSLGDDTPDTAHKVIAENDVTMMAKIMDDAKSGEGDRRKWASRIVDRNHHRVVLETGVNAYATDVRRSKELMMELQDSYTGHEFLHDVAEGTIHKLLTRDDTDSAGLLDLALLDADGRWRQIGVESQMLSKIPRKFVCARIFCDLTREEKELREKMKEDAGRKWREKGGN